MNTNNPKSNKYAELSRWCIGEADNYLRRRNKLQASERGWGAAAYALKAIAEKRGWNHNGHDLIIDIAKQLADEQARPELLTPVGVAHLLYLNFYNDELETDVIEIYLSIVKPVLPELERIRSEPPPDFTPETGDQRDRWRRLTAPRQPNV